MFYACSVKDSVEPLSKVAWFRVVSFTVADEGTILTEVKLLSQLIYGFNSGVAKWNCPFTCGAFGFADLNLPARLKLYPIPFLNLFRSLVDVQYPVLKVDVTIKQTKIFYCPKLAKTALMSLM